MIKSISGGVTAPMGFTAAGIHCGVRRNTSKKDLALIYSDTLCNASAVYTKNVVKGAPLIVTKEHLADGKAQAIICNSGNANTCNADGVEKAIEMCKAAAAALGIDPANVIPSSTGVIGQPLPLEPIVKGIPKLALSLSVEGGYTAAEAIMTTDTIAKEAAVEVELGGAVVKIGGIAKGSGMIHPNMATLLGFITTDASITSELLSEALHEAVDESFNLVSIDGDTSTNDTIAILANGKSANPMIVNKDENYRCFADGLTFVCTELAKMVAADGEGASRLLICNVTGAKSKDDARKAARSAVSSSLLKAAIFGADANWGRVLCAIGYSGADFDPWGVSVDFASSKGTLAVCLNGGSIPFSEELAKEILQEKEITVNIRMSDGDGSATAYGCDLTYEYVKINGDYRT